MRADGDSLARRPRRAQAIANGDRLHRGRDRHAINLVPDDLRGLDRFEARKRVVADITAEGLAVMTEATDPRLGKAA